MTTLAAQYPDELFYDIEAQTWARVEADGSVVVGITALGIRLSGEIYMCRPKPAGQVVQRARSLAVVELAKSIVAVKSPLSGLVLEANGALVQRPQLVHEDPYGQGWLARLRPADWAADVALLVHGEAVAAAMAEHARLNRAD